MTDDETGKDTEDVATGATDTEPSASEPPDSESESSASEPDAAAAESGGPPDDSPGGEAEVPDDAEVHQGGVPRMTAPQSPQEEPAAATATQATRKAHLTVSRVEPWTVMRFSFVVSLVCFIVLFVAVAVIYTILSWLGVFDATIELIASLTEGEDDDIRVNPETWFSPARVLGYTGVVGALNIIVITALATVGSMLYNLTADLVGGIDVTLNESE
ncbi:DUF3566 domain-containing protein [Halostreptopolyspora alba]|uniref:DUF3566 domain-containing protein n=1 Tax=Halostreptopolyspora alba TaxID=2487137 RepID=UPI00371E70AA